MTVAVMGCIVNGPGESKHADIGISLPGTGEAPAAPVFIDGEKAMTLRGENLSGQFKAIVGIAASAPAPYRIIPISPIEPLRIKVAQNLDLGLESMTIGPFLTDAGHYLNDGAPVQAQARLSNGQALSVDAWVQDGKVVIDWLLPAGVTMSSVLISSPMGQTKHDLATVPKGRP